MTPATALSAQVTATFGCYANVSFALPTSFGGCSVQKAFFPGITSRLSPAPFSLSYPLGETVDTGAQGRVASSLAKSLVLHNPQHLQQSYPFIYISLSF
jgi:hypothetical protein